MVAKRTGLGRGLEALLGTPVPVHAPASAQGASAPGTPDRSTGETLTTVDVDLLVRGAYQPRLDMHLESLEDLAASIRAQGVIQPIVVRPLAEKGPGGTPVTRSWPASAGGGPPRWPGSSPSRW